MLTHREIASEAADDVKKPARSFRIAVPSFGQLCDAVAPMIERQRISREEILDIFRDRLRPGKKAEPGLPASEASQADVARRLRSALYPND